jgi:hypothetical protein
MNHTRILIALAAMCCAVPLSAQATAPADAIRELQAYVRASGKTTAVYGTIRSDVEATIGSIRGCNVEVTRRTNVALLGNTAAFRVDLGRLSPEVAITPASGAPHLRVLELVTGNGEEEIPLTITTRNGGRASSQVWRIGLHFGATEAPFAAQLFTAAIQACGGQAPTPEALARLAQKRLFADGNDPETFPLKGRCLQLVGPLVSAGTALPADSSLTVFRLTRGARLDVSGYVPDGAGRRRFTCSFRREGEAWVPDGANLARSATAPAPEQ